MGDPDDDEDMVDEMHAAVQDIDSGDLYRFRHRVTDPDLMRELIHAYTHAEVEHMCSIVDDGDEGDEDEEDDEHEIYRDMAPHYEMLSALWGGAPQPISFFSPLDALSVPRHGFVKDKAIAAVIDGLPPDADCRTALLYALDQGHGARTLEAVCAKGAFFAEPAEHEAGLVALLLKADIRGMRAVLEGLRRYRHNDDFVRGLFNFANDRGTALHVCCSMVPIDDLSEKIALLLEYGVDPVRVTHTQLWRAADFLVRRSQGVPADIPAHGIVMRCISQLCSVHGTPVNVRVKLVKKKVGGGRFSDEMAHRLSFTAFDTPPQQQQQQQQPTHTAADAEDVSDDADADAEDYY